MLFDVIASGDKFLNRYVLNCITHVIQHLGIKTRTALTTKGLRWIGKGRFTNVICKILFKYSECNATDIQEMTGNFNSVVEYKILIILNEVKNSEKNKYINRDSVMNVITDIAIWINEKNEPRRTSENSANLIFYINNPYHVEIELNDDRYIAFSWIRCTERTINTGLNYPLNSKTSSTRLSRTFL
jgi:thiamine pyrophosphokinase